MFVALVLLAWHAIRIPIEGDVATSLAHADDVLGLERALSLDVEHAVIGRLDDANITPALEWLYTNIHLPVLFAFIAAARLLAPERYPVVRTTFALAFLPAALVIWLYPLAPPHWLPEFGFGVPPTDAELTNTTGALFHNTTAAAASQHFGFRFSSPRRRSGSSRGRGWHMRRSPIRSWSSSSSSAPATITWSTASSEC